MARRTNLALFIALLLVFATGVGAVATGSAHGRWVVVGHGVAAIAVVLLSPWKGRVVRAGLRRTRPTRWLSLLLAALVVTTVLLGLAHSAGLARVLWWHIAAALVLVPLLVWHIAARRARPRRA